MNKSKSPENKQDAGDVIREGDNISTLREILFGNKVAEFEKRFDTLEKHLDRELSGIRNDVDKLYKTLESFFKDENKSLLDRLKTEQEDRQDSEKSIRENIDAVGKKLSVHKEETADSQRELRKQLLDQNKTLTDEIHQLKRDLQTALDHKSLSLDEKKVDRLALADMLSKVAIQLGKEKQDNTD